MKRRVLPVLRAYGLALLSSAAVLLLSLLLRPTVDLAVLPLLLCAVMLSAWAGGAGPGILATILSSLAVDYFFMPPQGALSLEAHLLHLGEFVLSGLVITGLTSALRRENARRREVEDDLRRFSAGLERRLEESTRALQDAAKELDTLSYAVSHDLRAPLRAMGSFGEILLEEYGPKLDAGARDYARRVSEAAQRMDRLIQDLLAYSRLKHDELRFQDVDLDLACGRALESLSERLAGRGASLSLRRPLGRVFGSPELAERMLTHLIANASAFGGREPRIRVWSERRGAALRVWVEDDGPGIPDAFQDRLFRVFERLQQAKPGSGTGMGLAWVRRAAERQGGSCGLESKEGKGTRVWFELPSAPA